MLFYVAKGLQLAGLIGGPVALYVGMTQADGMAREIGLALLSMLLFYTGRLIETR